MVGVLIETTNSYNGFIVSFPHLVIAKRVCDEANHLFALLSWIASLSLTITLKEPL